MRTDPQQMSIDKQENAGRVIRIWQSGKHFLNELVQRPATGRTNHLVTTITVAAALMMIASSPAQAQRSFVNLVNSVTKKCLQPTNNSTTLGDVIVPQPCDPNNTSQIWIQTGSSGVVHFINYNSKLCLDARGGAAEGTPIEQWTCDSITNENWRINKNKYDALVSAVSGTSKYCLANTGPQDGAPLELYLCTGVESEVWNRPEVYVPPPPICKPTKSHPCP